MLCFIALHCKEYGYMRTWNVHNARKTFYIGIEAVLVQLLLQLENKQQIMLSNVETQHKHMYSLYIILTTIYVNPLFISTCRQFFLMIDFWNVLVLEISPTFYIDLYHSYMAQIMPI